MKIRVTHSAQTGDTHAETTISVVSKMIGPQNAEAWAEKLLRVAKGEPLPLERMSEEHRLGEKPFCVVCGKSAEWLYLRATWHGARGTYYCREHNFDQKAEPRV